MAENELDFGRICRTCMCESTDLHCLFDEKNNKNDDARIDEMLMACASVQVSSEDGLPNSMCGVCSEMLQKCYAFKQQCEKSDKNLRELLKGKLNNVKQEYQNVTAKNMLDELNSLINNDLEASDESQPNEDKYIPEPGEISPKQSDKCDFIEFLENNRQILTCRICYRVFTSVEGLRCHKRLHLGGMLKCKICHKEYTRQSHLQRHEMTHHGKRKAHVCKICNKILTRFEHLKRHLTIHLKDKPFTCEICQRGFGRQERYASHVRGCKGERMFICDVCNKAFKRLDSLELHRRLHDNKEHVLVSLESLDNLEEHYYQIDFDESAVYSDNSDFDNDNEDLDDCLEPQINITENCEEGQIDGGKIVEENDENEIEDKANINCYLDEKCDGNETQNIESHTENKGEEMELESFFPLEEDMESTDSDYVPNPRKVKRGRGRPRIHPMKSGNKSRGRPKGRVSKTNDEIESGEDPDGDYPCYNCDKVFIKTSSLNNHKCKSSSQDLHKCDVCNKEFSRPNHLKRHMSSHSESKPFVCTQCTKCFNRRDHLLQHMKLHSSEQDYECDECQRRFARPDHLAKHKASKHGEKTSAEKKYKCTVCGKGFTTEKYRDIHLKGHAGEKRFQCKTCDKCFISKSHLTEHMKFHNDNSKKFLCSECGQRFIRNDYLVIHMRRHRGEKPFKCKYCGKGFPRTTDLTVHERYHTGEKTHLCTICGRGFGRAYNLTVHMRTHTGEKPYQCTYCDAAFAQGNDLKAHVRRHTGERFQCDLCTETFLMGYLLTQHKRSVHGLNVVSNIRRLQPVNRLNQQTNPDDQPAITIPLPVPIGSQNCMAAQIQAQISAVQLPQTLD